MRLRQSRAKASVAFVAHDERRAGFGDKKIRAANAHFGAQKVLPQATARDGGEGRDFAAGKIGGRRPPQFAGEQFLDFERRFVHGRGDDVRRRLVGELDDELAQIGFDRFAAGRGERGVEPDFFGNHRFRFDRQAGFVAGGDGEQMRARGGGVFGPQHHGAGGGRVFFEAAQIIGHVIDRVRADLRRPLAQALEFVAVGERSRALVGGVFCRRAHNRLEATVGGGLLGAADELNRRGLHDIRSAIAARRRTLLTSRVSTSAKCKTRGDSEGKSSPPRAKRPSILSIQPRSPIITTGAAAAAMARHLRAAMAAETSPNLTAKAPPKPQHSSHSGDSRNDQPAAASKRRGCFLIPNSRKPAQQS